MSRVTGKVYGTSVDNLRSKVYQGLVGQSGAIRMMSASSCTIFWSTRTIRQKGGKAYPNKFVQLMVKASIVDAKGSGLKAQKGKV